MAPKLSRRSGRVKCGEKPEGHLTPSALPGNHVGVLGAKYGRLTVLGERRERLENGKARRSWYCRCECGTEKWFNAAGLRSGRRKSCGCLKRHIPARTSSIRPITVDGVTRSMSEWARISGLTLTQLYKRLRRGWPPDKAVKTPPVVNIWDPKSRLHRKPRTLTVDGETKTLSEWAADLGVSRAVIQARLRLGWPAEKAVRTPLLVKPRETEESEELLMANEMDKVSSED